MSTSTTNMARVIAGAVFAGLASSLAGGCRGDHSDKPPRQFFESLDDQPKYKSQSKSRVFADGRSMRQPPPGAVAFGDREVLSFGSTEEQKAFAAALIGQKRSDMLREDDRVYLGVGSDGKPLDWAPMDAILGAGFDEAAVTRLIEKGRERYNIYCIVCHGGDGKGGGAVGVQWNTAVANLMDPKYQRGGELGQDGHIFQVIRNGLPNAPGQSPALRMPAYGDKINEREAWAIVAYIRAMQASISAPLETAPEAERERLRRMMPSAGAGAPTTGGAQ
jgi:mono/diheme cytochrome c family protein